MIDLTYLSQFIDRMLAEDIKDGDHTSLSCIPAAAQGKAQLIIKDDGILAGVTLGEMIFKKVDPHLRVDIQLHDGTAVKKGDIGLIVSGSQQSILTAERSVLNCMQRMSGIATSTNLYVKAIEGCKAKVLDTRKTTPTVRYLEKWAVKIGGGHNHRMGLYDMVMIKDNHHDFCGGITQAVKQTQAYLKTKKLSLKIEVEVRNLTELEEALSLAAIDRVMLDNFDVPTTYKAVKMVNGQKETESSGGITLDTIRPYAETGVDFISVGALTHSFKSMDISLKAM